MKNSKIIIIGAGIGGLATGIKLAQEGFQVTIFEKNSQPGGRCQWIVKNGHIFDTGPTMYIFPELYENFFASIGEDIHTYIKLKKADPTYQLNFPDNTHLILTSDFKKMRSRLEKIEPGSYTQFLRYLEAAKKHYELTINHLVGKDFTGPFEYFNPLNFYRVVTTNALLPHHWYTRKFFKHPHLQAAFTFQDSYVSLSPYQAPAVFSLFTYTECIHGNYLPQGGMYQIIIALEKIARKYGVKIRYESPVKKVAVSGNQAVSVTLQNNQVEKADYFVLNTDLTYAYNQLLPVKSFFHTSFKKNYSSSAIVFHWGLDKVYPQLKTHNLFFTDPYKKGFDQVLNRAKPPDEPHFYIQAPARTDPSRAPENQDTLSVMIPINRIYTNQPVNWNVYKKKVRKFVIHHLNQKFHSDIEKHIKFEICYLPTDWQSYLNLTNGSVYGLHHDMTQLGYLRPGRQHGKFKNIFFVGASNHPGSGLPTVLRCAHYTSQRILTYNSTRH